MRLIWLDGAPIDPAKARIDPADRGFTLGDGVFETIRAEDGAPAYLTRHLKRLHRGAAVLGIEVLFSDGILTKALRLVADGEDCALRLTLTRGPMARGVLPARTPLPRPTLLITSSPLPPPVSPARVIVATCTRRNEFSPLSGIKSLNYGDSILARQEADARGADDALLLNTQGHLAEASAACVFLVINGSYVTPPLADGALDGIGRGVMLRETKAAERRVTQADIGRATSGFLVNALGIRELGSIDGREVEVLSRRY